MAKIKNSGIADAGEDVEKKEHSYCWWDCKLVQPLGKSDWLRSKIQVTADAGEDVEKEEHSSTAGGLQLIQPLWKSVWLLLRKLEIDLLEDPAIPLLGINSGDVPTCNKDTCPTMFIATLFIIARSWKEPR